MSGTSSPQTRRNRAFMIALRRWSTFAIVVMTLIMGIQLTSWGIAWYHTKSNHYQLLETLREVRLMQNRHARSRMAYSPSLETLGVQLPEGVEGRLVSVYVERRPSWYAQVCSKGACLGATAHTAPRDVVPVPAIAEVRLPAFVAAQSEVEVDEE